jgi:thiamine biosynthesis lipoprotein
VRKSCASARLDLGGVAKGYGIDRAFEALTSAGCDGVLVDVGGDVRVRGIDARGEPWLITVRDPFGGSNPVSFELENGAVCTSGNYERFVTIDGVRYSHIIDPRTGRPADRLPSVTVVSGDAMTADAWATALSVLGPDGLGQLPRDVEALIVEGDERSCRVHASAAMVRRLDMLPEPLCASGF